MINFSCPHGPTLLFQTSLKGEPRRYYACSAYRAKKFCDFHHGHGDKITSGKLLKWNEARRSFLRDKDHVQLYRELVDFQSSAGDGGGHFCQTCGRIVVRGAIKDHKAHLLTPIDQCLLATPTKILKPLSEDKKEAQYFFNTNTVRLIVQTLQSQQFSHVLCLGAPSIFENLCNENSAVPQLRRLLMDLDSRFLALLGPLDFVWFNMMNFHFFQPDSGRSVYSDFLSELTRETLLPGKLAVVLDPPFGARHELLAASLRRIRRDVKRLAAAATVNIFWIFPYFMEKKLGQEADLGLKG
jgi:hypothetical protein